MVIMMAAKHPFPAFLIVFYFIQLFFYKGYFKSFGLKMISSAGIFSRLKSFKMSSPY